MTDITAENSFPDARLARAGQQTSGFAPWVAEARALGTLSLPLIATQLAHMAMPTTDLLMLGVLGQKALAIAAIANTIYIFVWLIGLGPASAVAPVVAQIVGAHPNDRARVRTALRMGLWAVALLTIPLWTALAFAEPVLVALGQPEALAAAAAPYIHVLALGLPFSLGFTVFRNFSTALGHPRAPLIVVLIAVALNAGLNYSFIFGAFGMPEFGFMGAAMATALANAFCFFAMLSLLTFAPSFRLYRIWRRGFRADWSRLAEILRLGVSIGMTMIFEVALFAGSTLVMGQFGTSAVAAHQIAMNVPSITFMVPLGIAMAATVRVGRAKGAGDIDAARRAGITALLLGTTFMLVCALVLALIPGVIASLYLDAAAPENAEAISLLVSFLYVAAAFQIFDALQVIAAFSLRGMKDVRVPMVIAGLSYWGVGFPLTLLLGFTAGLAGFGVWLGLAASLAMAALLLTRRFLHLSAPQRPLRSH
jgi:MATE family multidrug resistance protein